MIKDLPKHLARSLLIGEWTVICCCLHIWFLVVVKLCHAAEMMDQIQRVR